MATPFDGLAKEILDVMLHEYGALETESEAPALRSQRADVLFVPDPVRTAARRSLGLLGRMTDAACLFEPFHEAPSLDDVTECLRKLLNHRHARSLKHTHVAERSWLLCAGRPDDALASLRARSMPRWPRGFYELSPALPLSIVVLSELPDDDDTLALRLMGAGETFGAALHELRARYGRVPRGQALYVAVVQMLLAARKRGETLTEAIMLDTTEAEEFLRRERREGRDEGLRPLVRLIERRLDRKLTEDERAMLLARLDLVGAVRLGDVVLDLEADALARWLADPDAR